MKIFAALGLAEQDPEAAWEWIRSNAPPDDHNVLVPFLWHWAWRKPEEALGLWKQHAETLSPDHYSALATGLCSRDPIVALEIYSDQTHFPEAGARSVSFLGWVSSLSAIAPSQAWPLLPELGEYITPAQTLTVISQNLHMLKLPPDSESQARHLIERQLAVILTR